MSASLLLAIAASATARAAADEGVDTNAPFAVATNSYAFGQAPDWAPGTDRVLYHDDYHGGEGQQVYTSNLDGSRRTCITCGQPGPNMVPHFRPQGDKILFHSWRGKNITIGAPGFGGIGSDVYVVNPDGSHPVALTNDSEGQDNYHAYWSPDGRQIVWTHDNCNFVTDTGRCLFDVRTADYVDDAHGPHLVNVQVRRPANGHFYETQWWAPDGSGFLYTESVDSAVNLELFFFRLRGPGPQITRLTNHPAWDEQAIFTPDSRNVIFMSTRDHPQAFNAYSSFASTAGLTPATDFLLVLPVFEAGFLQPVGGESTDLYEVHLDNLKTRRLTSDGDAGWIIPEFAWDAQRRRLLWTELRFNSATRTPIPPDAAGQGQGVLDLAQHPPPPGDCKSSPGGQGCELDRRTRIGRFVLADPVGGGTDAPGSTAHLGLPSNLRCLSRRRLVVHFPRRVRRRLVTSVRIYVNGRLVRRLGPRRRAVPIDLRGLPRSTVDVRVVATLTGRRRAVQHRIYHTCRSGRRR